METTLPPPSRGIDRYIRQQIMPVIGREGQHRLRASTMAIVGCGALGSAQADLLARAGVGRLVLIDRDYVELHNLQRQSLFDEADVASHVPKAIAAAERLHRVNSEIEVTPVVEDLHAANAEALLGPADLMLDGTDNFETRYLINEVAVKRGRPWIYGGVIASYGMTMTIRPGTTACLRCVFPEPPEAGSAPTCDTAGVLGPAVHAVAAIQAAEAIKLAVGDLEALNRSLLALDLWGLTFDRVPLERPRADCPTCRGRDFELLDRATPAQTTVLCGHDAVQVLVHPPVRLDLGGLAARLSPLGTVLSNRFLLRFDDPTSGKELTVFPDGRAIVKGTTDPTEARAFYARYVGS